MAKVGMIPVTTDFYFLGFKTEIDLADSSLIMIMKNHFFEMFIKIEEIYPKVRYLIILSD